MKHLFLAIGFTLLFSCKEKNQPITTNKKDLSIAALDSGSMPAERTHTSSILGPWTSGLSDNALFDIGKDSIFYVEDLESFRYVLTGDSIKIFYPDYTFQGRIQLQQDTLTITTEG